MGKQTKVPTSDGEVVIVAAGRKRLLRVGFQDVESWQEAGTYLTDDERMRVAAALWPELVDLAIFSIRDPSNPSWMTELTAELEKITIVDIATADAAPNGADKS